jgi:hypothetical protein
MAEQITKMEAVRRAMAELGNDATPPRSRPTSRRSTAST